MSLPCAISSQSDYCMRRAFSLSSRELVHVLTAETVLSVFIEQLLFISRCENLQKRCEGREVSGFAGPMAMLFAHAQKLQTAVALRSCSQGLSTLKHDLQMHRLTHRILQTFTAWITHARLLLLVFSSYRPHFMFKLLRNRPMVVTYPDSLRDLLAAVPADVLNKSKKFFLLFLLFFRLRTHQMIPKTY